MMKPKFPEPKPVPPEGEMIIEGVIRGGWLDRLFKIYDRRKATRKRERARRRLGLDIPTADHRIHETSRGGSTSPQEAETMLDDAQATQEPTDADVEDGRIEGNQAMERAELDAEEGDPGENPEMVTDERAEMAVAATEIPTIILHYLGFTLNRKLLPTGHFQTKAKLVAAMDPAILNKGWNIASATLDPASLPEVGCHREKSKAIAAATRAAKAAAPCRLQILDSDGEEVESRTFRQPKIDDDPKPDNDAE